MFVIYRRDEKGIIELYGGADRWNPLSRAGMNPYTYGGKNQVEQELDRLRTGPEANRYYMAIWPMRYGDVLLLRTLVSPFQTPEKDARPEKGVTYAY